MLSHQSSKLEEQQTAIGCAAGYYRDQCENNWLCVGFVHSKEAQSEQAHEAFGCSVDVHSSTRPHVLRVTGHTERCNVAVSVRSGQCESERVHSAFLDLEHRQNPQSPEHAVNLSLIQFPPTVQLWTEQRSASWPTLSGKLSATFPALCPILAAVVITATVSQSVRWPSAYDALGNQ